MAKKAREAFDAAQQGEAIVFVPAIVLAEFFYLNAKLGQPMDFATVFAQLLEAEQFSFVPFSAVQVLLFERVGRDLEMHDAIVASTAYRLDACVLTRDHSIAAEGAVETVW